MPIDDRKQRIMMAIVSLYANGGEPVGSHLLSRYFDMTVSSATLRNEMAALTRLGLLEQPHTSAGRVPTTKGYRFYVDNLLGAPSPLSRADKAALDALFQGLDYDPEKLTQGAAKALSDLLGLAVIATTPRSQDASIAHFEVIQVGRYSAAVLAVTNAGGVLTRVAKAEQEFADGETAQIAAALNRYLRFVAEADVSPTLIRTMVDSLGRPGPHSWPVVSAALTLLSVVGKPNIYLEGQQHLLLCPELERSLRPLLEMLGDEGRMEKLLYQQPGRTLVQFGGESSAIPVPDFCLVSRQYCAGSGCFGAIAVAGPARMRFSEVIPRLEYFSDLLGRSMGAPGAA